MSWMKEKRRKEGRKETNGKRLGLSRDEIEFKILSVYASGWLSLQRGSGPNACMISQVISSPGPT